MSTHNKLFEKLLNYLIKRRIILKTIDSTFWGLGVPNKKMKKGYKQKKKRKYSFNTLIGVGFLFKVSCQRTTNYYPI